MAKKRAVRKPIDPPEIPEPPVPEPASESRPSPVINVPVVETVVATSTESPTTFSVCCPALGGPPFVTECRSVKEAEKAFRDACKGLSEDAVLSVEAK